MTVDQKCFEEPTATMLEQDRMKARKKRRMNRIMYDCLNAQVISVAKDDSDQLRVTCPLYKITVKRETSLTLLQVLRGTTPVICQDCKEYREDEEGKLN